jgi:hypothetical protein
VYLESYMKQDGRGNWWPGIDPPGALRARPSFAGELPREVLQIGSGERSQV